MLKITSPRRFIRNIRILNIIIGIVFALFGIYGIRLYSLTYSLYNINYFPDLFTIIILFILSALSIIIGINGMFSSLFFNKLKYLGIKLSIILYILICIFLLLIPIDIILIVFTEKTRGGINTITILLAYVGILIFNFSLFIASMLLFLKIKKNKDILKECIGFKIEKGSKNY